MIAYKCIIFLTNFYEKTKIKHLKKLYRIIDILEIYFIY